MGVVDVFCGDGRKRVFCRVAAPERSGAATRLFELKNPLPHESGILGDYKNPS